MRGFFDRTEDKMRRFLSHYPIFYGLLTGAGIVLFWRGVWHTADSFHTYVYHYYLASTIDWTIIPWWDGPISLVVGAILLLICGTFVSSFIGNEIIISGLRGEKKLSERTEAEVQTEAGAIAEIQQKLDSISEEISELRGLLKK